MRVPESKAQEGSIIMTRAKRVWTVLAGALALMAVSAWLCPEAAAQFNAKIYGQVLDRDGKPFADVTVVIKSDMGQTWEVKTDRNGKYSQAGLRGGNTVYTVSFKVKDQVIWEEQKRLASGAEEKVDLNIKDTIAKQGAAAVEQQKKEEEQKKQFETLKTHFDAGRTALEEARLVRGQMQRAPAEQRPALQDKLKQTSTTAVTELQAAEKAVGENDPNHHIVLAKLGDAYETAGRYEEAAAAYQKAIELKPDEATYYNNMGNALAKLGKIPEAMAAYAKSASLDPANAANAWRNAGIVLYNANRAKEAVEPLRKALEIDPKSAQAWYLLGASLVNLMGYKQEGDKVIPILQPGTIEAYQKAIELDPNGPYGLQAKQGLEALQQMGVSGIETRVLGRKKK